LVAQIRLVVAAAVVELEVVVVGTTPLAPLVELVVELVLVLLAVDEAILVVASSTLPRWNVESIHDKTRCYRTCIASCCACC